MFSKLFRLVFVVTAYSPILLIWWIVGIFTFIGDDGKTQIHNVADITFFDLKNNYWLLISFILLLAFSGIVLYLAHTKLTRNHIEVKSIKSADFNMTTLLLSYFLPCVEFYKKDTIFVVGWIVVLVIVILIIKNSYFYNPLMKLFGYRYYEIATKREVTFTMISKRKLINSKDINSYTQLTDYVILNTD